MLKELLGDLWSQEIEDALKGKMELVGSEPKIPKSRFDAVNQEKKDLKAKVDELLKKLEDSTNDAETIEQLKNQLTQTKTEYDSYVENVKTEKVNSQKKDALISYLKEENVLNPELLLPFYNLEEITFDGDKLVGITAKTESLKIKFKDQFGEVKVKSPDITNKFKDKAYKDLSLAERTAWKQKDPQGYAAARQAHLKK
jgi:vacuolar-type H+-ATPase subunit I/STV1